MGLNQRIVFFFFFLSFRFFIYFSSQVNSSSSSGHQSRWRSVMERIAKRNILSGISGRFTAGDITDTHAHNKQSLFFPSRLWPFPFFSSSSFASAAVLLLESRWSFSKNLPAHYSSIHFIFESSSSGAFLSFKFQLLLLFSLFFYDSKYNGINKSATDWDLFQHLALLLWAAKKFTLAFVTTCFFLSSNNDVKFAQQCASVYTKKTAVGWCLVTYKKKIVSILSTEKKIDVEYSTRKALMDEKKRERNFECDFLL